LIEEAEAVKEQINKLVKKTKEIEKE